ncbi:MAG: Ribonuclease protein component [Bacteroidota bacterium]
MCTQKTTATHKNLSTKNNSLNFTYPKSERLKSKTTINLLFSAGKSVSKYPLRLVYVPVNLPEEEPIKMGVSVSKKYFKKAVDRNYFKRVLRETYRLNKHLLQPAGEQRYAFMFFYQTSERLPYAQIEEKTKLLFQKFVDQAKSDGPQ